MEIEKKKEELRYIYIVVASSCLLTVFIIW